MTKFPTKFEDSIKPSKGPEGDSDIYNEFQKNQSSSENPPADVRILVLGDRNFIFYSNLLIF